LPGGLNATLVPELNAVLQLLTKPARPQHRRGFALL
jgi:hypothetical protein